MAKYRGIDIHHSGAIRLRWEYQGRQHIRLINKTATNANLADAARVRKRLVELTKLGQYECEEPGLGQETFKDCCELLLRDRLHLLKPSTLKAYKALLEKWWSELGDFRMIDIMQRHLIRIDSKNNWPHTKTRNNAVSAMRQVFRHAKSLGVTDVDVSLGMKPAKVQTKEMDAFTNSERVAILDNLKGVHRLMYLLMFECGFRTGELLALEWSDWSGQSMRVSKSMWNGQIQTTKTHQARTAHLSPASVDSLKAFEKTGARFKSKFIIAAESGKPFGYVKVPTDAFIKACKLADVRYRRPYYARHTYVTNALNAGLPLVKVAQQIGDRVQTMEKSYAHITRDKVDHALMDSIFKK